MKRALGILLAALLGVAAWCATARADSQTFTYQASQYDWTVPAGVTSVTMTVKGARGGNTGGTGAIVAGTLAVTEGTHYYICVGSAGANSSGSTGGAGGKTGNTTTGGAGGTETEFVGAGGGGGGGGASDVRTVTTTNCNSGTFDNRIIVGAGGGGKTGSNGGGAASGTTGAAGSGSGAGQGGTPSAGGAGGGHGGLAGAKGIGGAGGDNCYFNGGGGGGAGLYGGGGGRGDTGCAANGAGGGAGSSYVSGSFTNVSYSGGQTGNGAVVFEWIVASPPDWVNGSPEIQAASGSADGEIDVSGNCADDGEGDDPVEYRVLWDADASGYSSFDEWTNATSWITEASFCVANAFTYTITGLAEGEVVDVTVETRDSLGSPADYDSGTDYVAYNVVAKASPPLPQDAGGDSDIRIDTPDQSNALLVRSEIFTDAAEPVSYAIHYNTSASDSGAMRYPATGYLQGQPHEDTDADGVLEVAFWLLGLDPLTTYYVAVEACDALGTCSAWSLEGADVASATTLPRLYMDEGDVAATALTFRWENGTGNSATIYWKTNATDCSSSDYTSSDTLSDGTNSRQVTGLTADQDVCAVVSVDGSPDSRKVVARPTQKASLVNSTVSIVMGNALWGLNEQFTFGQDFRSSYEYAPGNSLIPFTSGVAIYADSLDDQPAESRIYMEHNGGGDDYYKLELDTSFHYVVLTKVVDGSPTTIGNTTVGGCTAGELIGFRYVVSGSVEARCGSSTVTDSALSGAVTGFRIWNHGSAVQDVKLFGGSSALTVTGMPSSTYALRCSTANALQASAAASGGTAALTLGTSLGGWYEGRLKVSTQNSDCTTGILADLPTYHMTPGSTYRYAPTEGKHLMVGPLLRDVQPDSFKIQIGAEQPYGWEIEVRREGDPWPGVFVRGPTPAQIGTSTLPVYWATGELADGLPPATALEYRIWTNGEPGTAYPFPTDPADGIEGDVLILAEACFAENRIPYSVIPAMGSRCNLYRAAHGAMTPVKNVAHGDLIYENSGAERVFCWATKTNPTCANDVVRGYIDALSAPGSREQMRTGSPWYFVEDDHDGCRNDCTGANMHAWVDANGNSDGGTEYTLTSPEITAFRDAVDAIHMAGNPDPYDPAVPEFAADQVGRVLVLVLDEILYRDDLNATNQTTTESAGTVSINAGDDALTGSGTTLTNMDVNDPIRIDGAAGDCWYTIASVTDATHATIHPDWGACGEDNVSGVAFLARTQFDAPNSGSKTFLGGLQFAAMTRAVYNALGTGTVDHVVMLSSKSWYMGCDHADAICSSFGGKPGFVSERGNIETWFTAHGVTPTIIGGDNHNTAFHLASAARDLTITGGGPNTFDCAINGTVVPSSGTNCRVEDFLSLALEGGAASCPGGVLDGSTCLQIEAYNEDLVGTMVGGYVPSSSAESGGSRYLFTPQTGNHVTQLSNGRFVVSRGRQTVAVSDDTPAFNRFGETVNTGGSDALDNATGLTSDGTYVYAGRDPGTQTTVRKYSVSGQTLTFVSDTNGYSGANSAYSLIPAVTTDGARWVIGEFLAGSNRFLAVFRNGTFVTGDSLDDGESGHKRAAIVAAGTWVGVAWLNETTNEIYFRYCDNSPTCEQTGKNDETTGQFDSYADGDYYGPGLCGDGSQVLMVRPDGSGNLSGVLMDASKTRGSSFTIESAQRPVSVSCAYWEDQDRWIVTYVSGGIIYVRATDDSDPEVTDWPLLATIEGSGSSAFNLMTDAVTVTTIQDRPFTGTKLPLLIAFRPDPGNFTGNFTTDSYFTTLNLVGGGGRLILDLLEIL